jgi:hypothetical protein
MDAQPEVSSLKKGSKIQLRPGLHAFRWLEFVVDDGSDYLGRVRLEFERGRYVVTRFSAERRPDGPNVTAAGIRAMPIGEMAEAGKRQYGLVVDDDVQDAIDAYSGADLRARGMKDGEVLDLIAIVYEGARASGESTSAAVAEFLECSIAAAEVWISKAKKGGQLKHWLQRRG